jgi:beta-phosphoglucomutase-like phosphatase (HAD superfamily)
MLGVREYIADAERLGLRLGVASSSSRVWVLGHLERLRLNVEWDAVRTRDDVARTKPAPDLYLAAVEALGVAPHKAVAFEDSLNGIAAAKAAGLLCVAVPNALTAGIDLSRADVKVEFAGGDAARGTARASRAGLVSQAWQPPPRPTPV